MFYQDYISEKAFNAINEIGVDYFEYNNGKICTKIDFRKIHLETDLRKGRLLINYTSNVEVFDGGDYCQFMKNAGTSTITICTTIYEDNPVEFSMGCGVEVNPETDVDYLKDVILTFAATLHDNIQLALDHGVDITLNS